MCYVKDTIYRTKIRNITELKRKIATSDEAILQRTWQEIDFRLDVLPATNRHHIEVYELTQKKL